MMQGKRLIILLMLVGGLYVQAGENLNPKPGESSKKSTLFLGIFEKYQRMQSDLNGLELSVFMNAYLGYLNLSAAGLAESPILTIVDFKKPSSEPRMWILDLQKENLLLLTWAAHGKGSGREMAETFSNTPESFQTSLGFYLTAEEYRGKNGRSLRLDGMDKGYNSNARKRHVVMHGADYVSAETLAQNGYLGNSEGCPAVAREVNDLVIDWVKGRSVLFITGNAENYQSQWLNPELLLSASWSAPYSAQTI